MIKSEIHQKCIEVITDKIGICGSMLASLDESAASDGKSSAGDKFETSREMIQQERDRVDAQLAQLYAHLAQLNSIDHTEITSAVKNGSLVSTNIGSFYISIPLGKLKSHDSSKATLFAISTQSPMAKVLWNKKVGEQVQLNGKNIKIDNLS